MSPASAFAGAGSVGCLSVAPLVRSDPVIIPVEAHAFAILEVGSVVLKQTVRDASRLSEAPVQRPPITRYASECVAAQADRAVALECLDWMVGTDAIA